MQWAEMDEALLDPLRSGRGIQILPILEKKMAVLAWLCRTVQKRRNLWKCQAAVTKPENYAVVCLMEESALFHY